MNRSFFISESLLVDAVSNCDRYVLIFTRLDCGLISEDQLIFYQRLTDNQSKAKIVIEFQLDEDLKLH